MVNFFPKVDFENIISECSSIKARKLKLCIYKNCHLFCLRIQGSSQECL